VPARGIVHLNAQKPEGTPAPSEDLIRIVAQTTTTGKTGIEMEAFVAAAIGALALYDMVKAVDPAATITDLQLLDKSGGRAPFTRRAA
jgi:cyclic pyranopterin phosphate synthase